MRTLIIFASWEQDDPLMRRLLDLTQSHRGAVEQMPGGLSAYTATIPPGQVGVWAGSGQDEGSPTVTFDDFKVLSMNAMVDVDGRWRDDVGGTRPRFRPAPFAALERAAPVLVRAGILAPADRGTGGRDAGLTTYGAVARSRRLG